MTRRRILTDAQVREIHAAYRPGRQGGYRKLAEQYGVAESTVRYIVTCRAVYALAATLRAWPAREVTHA